MDFLEITAGCTVVKLRKAAGQTGSLEEQAAEYLKQNPFLLFDVGALEFTSMNIGELVNLVSEFDQIWGDRLHHLGLINLSPTGQSIFERTGLAAQFPHFETVSEAMRVFTGN